MNSKTISLFRRLMDGQPHKLAELAEYLQTSPRLVRYEMSEAGAFLEKEGLGTILQHNREEGWRLTPTAEERQLLEEKLSNLDTRDYVMSSAERRIVMQLMLLASGPEPLTSQYFADQFGVSKSSSDKDLALLKSDLAGSGISLDSRVSKGSTLKGEETAIRRSGVRILEQQVDFESLYQGSQRCGVVERWARELFCDGTVPALFALLRSAEQNVLARWFTFDSFRMLILTLAVSLVRVRKGMYVNNHPASMAVMRTIREYSEASRIAQALERRFKVRLPAGEVAELTLLLASAKYVSPEPYLKDDWAKVQVLLERLVHAMSEEMGVEFYRDEALYTALQAHLVPAVFRLRHGIPVTSFNAQEIRKNYPECFESMLRALDRLKSPLLENITEDDVACLVLHFCASLERQKRSLPVSRVAIVCMHGAGTANLLRELISSRFKNIRVVATVTHTELQSLLERDVDFVISSIPLPGCTLPWVQVDAIPGEQDWEKISRMMHQYSCPAVKNNPAVRFFKDVMAVVQRHCDVWDVDGLMNSLTACFETNGLPVQNGRIQPELVQLLTPDKMRCGCRADDWEEAVRLACGVLTETGDVTAEFERSAVESVKRAGPYIVIMPGIALVHGEAGKGVHRLAMSLVTLENPVEFHHPDNDPVRLVFCLAPADNWSHIQALKDLLDVLGRCPIKKLCGAKTPQELYRYFEGRL